MTTHHQKGSGLAHTVSREVIVNFCYTVLRSDDDRLKLAMSQYQQALAAEQRR